MLEEFGSQGNRDAYFRAAYEEVEASLASGGSLKGALFWQYYEPGQVRLLTAAAWLCMRLAAPAALHLHAASANPRPLAPLPHRCCCPCPPQTASRGEGGGAGQFGVYPDSPAFQLVKANAAAVQRLAGAAAAGACSPKGAPAAPPCADKGCGARARSGAGADGCTLVGLRLGGCRALRPSLHCPGCSSPHPALIVPALPLAALRALAATSTSTSACAAPLPAPPEQSVSTERRVAASG